MLKKIVHINLKLVGIILLLLIAAQIITAYFFGIMAENQFKSQFDKLTDSGFVKVVDYKYNRGWFVSSESVVLQLNNNTLTNISSLLPLKNTAESGIFSTESSNYRISYTSKVVNGIFAGWMFGNIMPTIAYSKANIEMPEKISKYVQTFFKDEKPLVLTAVIYISGNGKYQVTSPIFDYEEALSGVKINWGGANLVIKFNKNFDKFNKYFTMPSLIFYAPTKGNIELSDIKFSSDSLSSVNDIKVGDTSFSLGKLSVKLAESDVSKRFNLGDVISTSIGVNAVDFLNDIEIINPADFTLSNVNYHSTSNDVGGYFNSDVIAGFDKLTSESAIYGPLDFNFSIKHVRSDKFSIVADLLESMATIEKPTQEQKEHFSQQLKLEMTPILIESPIASINKLTLKLPSGLMSINGLVTTHGFESQDMEDQSKFLNKVYVTANLSVPKPVLSYLLFLQMKYFLSAGNAQLDEESSKSLSELVNILLDNQLKVWLHKGYMTEESGLVSTKFKLDRGDIYLNDISTSIPAK